MPFNEQALEHFLTLARRGKFQGSSGGEKRAAKILEVIMEHAGGLDQDAIDGAGLFMRLVAANYPLAEKLAKGAK